MRRFSPPLPLPTSVWAIVTKRRWSDESRHVARAGDCAGARAHSGSGNHPARFNRDATAPTWPAFGLHLLRCGGTARPELVRFAGRKTMMALEVIARLALWLLLAPLLPGIINKVKAWVAGRRGPPVLQLYYDLGRLWKKSVVMSTLASPAFLA